MAAPTKYATPLEQLIELATQAIRDGVEFETFWLRAVRPGMTIVMTTTKNAPEGAIRWPTDRNDRVTWQGAILDAQDGIRRAYEKEPPTVHEAGLMFLAPHFEAMREVERDIEREAEVDELTDLMAA